jgi:hypothetical protein
MPSAQDCAERLREQAYRTLLPQIRDLEQELQSVNDSLLAGFEHIGRKLESLRNIELPTTELILNEILDEVVRQKVLEANALVLFMRGLGQKETQEEILSFLLDSTHQYFPRVALFAVRGDRFIGWSSRGFPEALARNISSCSFVRSEYPQFQDALESENLMPATDFPENSPLRFLIEDGWGPWSLLSLRAMQHPIALFLAEGVEGESYKPNVLTIMTGLVALRLENIALRILQELTAAKPEAVSPPTVEEAAAASAPDVQSEPLPAAAAEEPILSQAPAAEPSPKTESILNLGTVQEPALQAAAAPVDAVGETSAAPERDQVEAPEPEPLPEIPKIQPQESRPVPEEEKLHADAKRFARLLVSEIKLYNEHHVAEGRGNRDLYLRLKRDIDRSREMYERRISPIVSRKIDYFHDEIIRILGDNDPSTLGSDYPGPRVES